MDRNLFRRIEVAFPVDAPELQDRVAEDLKLYLADDVQAWVMNSEGNYLRAVDTEDLSAQSRLLSLYDERVAFIDA
jgi:polyphosphate kinase